MVAGTRCPKERKGGVPEKASCAMGTSQGTKSRDSQLTTYALFAHVGGYYVQLAVDPDASRKRVGYRGPPPAKV